MHCLPLVLLRVSWVLGNVGHQEHTNDTSSLKWHRQTYKPAITRSVTNEEDMAPQQEEWLLRLACRQGSLGRHLRA